MDSIAGIRAFVAAQHAVAAATSVEGAARNDRLVEQVLPRQDDDPSEVHEPHAPAPLSSAPENAPSSPRWRWVRWALLLLLSLALIAGGYWYVTGRRQVMPMRDADTCCIALDVGFGSFVQAYARSRRQ